MRCFNSLQEVGFISTNAGQKGGRDGRSWFQFLTGSRFHFYGAGYHAGLGWDLRRFNSLQEVGFISTRTRIEAGLGWDLVSIPYRK